MRICLLTQLTTQVLLSVVLLSDCAYGLPYFRGLMRFSWHFSTETTSAHPVPSLPNDESGDVKLHRRIELELSSTSNHPVGSLSPILRARTPQIVSELPNGQPIVTFDYISTITAPESVVTRPGYTSTIIPAITEVTPQSSNSGFTTITQIPTPTSSKIIIEGITVPIDVFIVGEITVTIDPNIVPFTITESNTQVIFGPTAFTITEEVFPYPTDSRSIGGLTFSLPTSSFPTGTGPLSVFTAFPGEFELIPEELITLESFAASQEATSQTTTSQKTTNQTTTNQTTISSTSSFTPPPLPIFGARGLIKTSATDGHWYYTEIPVLPGNVGGGPPCWVSFSGLFKL